MRLKPCPLCGDSAELKHNSKEVNIRCMGCGLSLRRIYSPLVINGHESGRYMERRDALKEWNARPHTATQDDTLDYDFPDDNAALNYIEQCYGSDFRCAVSCMMDMARALTAPDKGAE